MRFWRTSLLARLLVAFLALAVISLAVVGAIAYQQGRQAVQDNIIEHLITTSTLKGNEIERWVAGLTQDMRLISQNPIATVHARVLVDQDVAGASSLPSYRTLKDFLDSMVAEKPDLMEIMVLKGTGGKVLLSTNSAHEGTYEVTSSFFVEGRKGTYVQNIYPSASLGRVAMTIATPLQDAAGQTFAVLAAHLNLDSLDTIMSERSGLGDTGETYLVDQYNTFVSEARGGREAFPRGVHTLGIDRAVRDRQDGWALYDNYQGVPVLGSYRWLPGRDMALLAEIQVSEALAPTRRLAGAILAVGLAVTLLVVIVAYTLARQITRPIRALTETSTRMASGNLDLSVPVSGQDEIGVLGRAFNSMAAQLRNLVLGLERRVAERTAQLEQRAAQLATAAEVGRVATSILEPHRLAQEAVDLLRERFGLYYAGLFLVDESAKYAKLEAGTGEAGRIMQERGHRLELGGASMVGTACTQQQPRIALDVGEEPARFDNPLLPDTRSEMALPLMVGERVLGALDVQSTERAAFSDEDIAVLQLAASQVAVALDNARKFSSEAAMLEATSPVFRMSTQLASANTADEVVRTIVDSVAETEADGCLVARFGSNAAGELSTITFVANWRRSPGPEVPLHQAFPIETSMMPVPLLSRFWASDDVAHDPNLPEASRSSFSALGIRAVANIPLQVGGQPIGFVTIDRTTPGPFSRVAVRLYETLASQAALALERSRLLDEARQRADRERLTRGMTDTIRGATSVQDAMERTLRELSQALGASEMVVRVGPEAELMAGRGGDGHE